VNITLTADRPPGAGVLASTRTGIAAKIVIAGGFGVGKTTFVGAVSEIAPVTTEAMLTTASDEVDDVSRLPGKTATTVAMDFGRITIDQGLVLYLFGTPGQTRFWFMWDELVKGAIGAVVLADVRRLTDAFAPVDFFEHQRLPFVVAVNQWDDAPRHHPEEIHHALALAPDVPVLIGDARTRDSAKQILISVVEHALDRRRTGLTPHHPAPPHHSPVAPNPFGSPR
jgi:signal recognition particle receptor subunit beta